MSNGFIVFFIVIGIFLFLWIGWRFLSTRFTLPCPTTFAWLVERDNPFTRINRAETIIEHLDLKPGMFVLDVGCGPGRLTIPIAKKVGPNGQVAAMDMQSGMLHRTQEKAAAEKLTNIKFLKAQIEKEKLEQGKFDRVLLVTVLGEIPDQQAAMKVIFDALKSGGILSVTEIIFDPHFQRRTKIHRLAKTIGFREKNSFGNSIAFTLNLEKP